MPPILLYYLSSNLSARHIWNDQKWWHGYVFLRKAHLGRIFMWCKKACLGKVVDVYWQFGASISGIYGTSASSGPHGLGWQNGQDFWHSHAIPPTPPLHHHSHAIPTLLFLYSLMSVYWMCIGVCTHSLSVSARCKRKTLKPQKCNGCTKIGQDMHCQRLVRQSRTSRTCF